MEVSVDLGAASSEFRAKMCSLNFSCKICLPYVRIVHYERGIGDANAFVYMLIVHYARGNGDANAFFMYFEVFIT